MLIAILSILGIWTGMWAVYLQRTYAGRRRKLMAKIKTMFHVPSPSSGWLARITCHIDQSGWGEQTARMLAANHLRITPSEYFVLLLTAFALIVWILRFLFELGEMLNLLLASSLVYAGRLQIFRWQKQRARSLFQQQLPEACRLLGNSLRAGLTLAQGIEILSNELPNPAKHEFQTVHKELILGVELKGALHSLQQRIQTREMELFVGSLLIQYKMGGNLAELLEDMARTIEERFLLHQSFKTMTAEAKP